MPTTPALTDVVRYLDGYLRTAEVPDYSNALNGLQVENRGRVARLVAAVDASQQTIDGVVNHIRTTPGGGPVLILVHHGLFWDGTAPMTGRRYRRIRALLEHDIALYAAHLPLDLHPEVGNNVGVARLLGLEVEGWFGEYQGTPLGVHGALRVERDELVARVVDALDTDATVIPGGPTVTQRVGVITGGAGSMIAAAAAAGCDTFLTGEGAHHTYFDATELGLNVVYAGHYATERVGVRSLARHVADRFGIPWEFHDHPTGL
jgi:dinuclear metal center YbgI/SA1388 family protein